MTEEVKEEEEKIYPFTFHGTAGEYFRIWFVNITLSILSLGVYSAWAKVRRLRYFYGNLHLDGHGFEFTGSPWRILTGRIIVFAFLILLSFAKQFGQFNAAWALLYSVLLLILLLATPWLVTRGRQFMLRNTLYRNIHFSFNGRYGQAYGALLWRWILVFLTFGLYLPFYFYHQNKFFINNSAFGRAHFQMHNPKKDFLLHYGKAILLLVVAYVLMGILLFFWLLLFGKWSLQGVATSNPWFAVSAFAVTALLITLYSLIRAAFLSAMFQAAWHNSTLDSRFRLHCTLRTLPLTWIFLTNTIANFASCGLLIPWSRIRLLRYLTAHICLLVKSDLNHCQAGQLLDLDAVATEFGDAFGMDIGFA
ncbi:YjgN family protein [Candidatus Magnetaquicoccus inordinatus]|uniref:YjgN family protein n=1 Tax=Candidatus Magnetaquicoccus inordinatus TaxID=2496818 RepID=UPI00102CE0C6|nr:YjgN family protein [Candidatus Magnetaquicoccus inordinatus]